MMCMFFPFLIPVLLRFVAVQDREAGYGLTDATYELEKIKPVSFFCLKFEEKNFLFTLQTPHLQPPLLSIDHGHIVFGLSAHLFVCLHLNLTYKSQYSYLHIFRSITSRWCNCWQHCDLDPLTHITPLYIYFLISWMYLPFSSPEMFLGTVSMQWL